MSIRSDFSRTVSAIERTVERVRLYQSLASHPSTLPAKARRRLGLSD